MDRSAAPRGCLTLGTTAAIWMWDWPRALEMRSRWEQLPGSPSPLPDWRDAHAHGAGILGDPTQKLRWERCTSFICFMTLLRVLMQTDGWCWHVMVAQLLRMIANGSFWITFWWLRTAKSEWWKVNDGWWVLAMIWWMMVNDDSRSSLLITRNQKSWSAIKGKRIYILHRVKSFLTINNPSITFNNPLITIIKPLQTVNHLLWLPIAQVFGHGLRASEGSPGRFSARTGDLRRGRGRLADGVAWRSWSWEEPLQIDSPGLWFVINSWTGRCHVFVVSFIWLIDHNEIWYNGNIWKWYLPLWFVIDCLNQWS